jgi:hypothetical protein
LVDDDLGDDDADALVKSRFARPHIYLYLHTSSISCHHEVKAFVIPLELFIDTPTLLLLISGQSAVHELPLFQEQENNPREDRTTG